MTRGDLHRYGGVDLARQEQRWPGVAVDRVRWRAAPGTTGEICKREHQLFVSLSGSTGRMWARTADGSSYAGREFPGAVTFVPAGCSRVARYEGGTLEYIGIRIAPDRHLHPGVPVDGLHPVTNQPDPLVHRVALTLDEARRQPAASLLADSAASLLLVHLHRRATATVGAASEPAMMSQRSLRRVVDYIEAHLGSSLRLAVLADVAALESHRFRLAFKEATGLSPHRFVTQRRMERAAELLRDPGGPSIADIAAQVGMSSQSHLTTVFGRA
jgi:AraC family transcriptional regulator